MSTSKNRDKAPDSGSERPRVDRPTGTILERGYRPIRQGTTTLGPPQGGTGTVVVSQADSGKGEIRS